jgi:hypothetical protein
LISTLICLSHLFVFVVFLMIIFLINISNIILNNHFKKKEIKKLIRLILFQLLSLSIGIAIALKFILSSGIQNPESEYLSFINILKILKEISPAKGINYARANIYTLWILVVFIASLVYLFIVWLYSLYKNKAYKFRNQLWLYITLSTLLLIFLVPDSKGVAVGFNTQRLALLFFLFLIVWIASQRVNIWFKILISVLVACVNISFVLFNYHSVKEACRISNEVIIAAQKIDAGSIVLPINNSELIITSHVASYLGVNKPLVIIDNYEATLDHFPLNLLYAIGLVKFAKSVYFSRVF